MRGENCFHQSMGKIPIISAAIRYDGWKQYTVQCMEAGVGSLCGWKEQNYRSTISARERRRTPTQWMVKHFIPCPAWGRRTAMIRGSGKKRSLRRGEESKHGRGSGLPASQSLPQLTKRNNQGWWWHIAIPPWLNVPCPPFLILWNHAPSQFSCCEHS